MQRCESCRPWYCPDAATAARIPTPCRAVSCVLCCAACLQAGAHVYVCGDAGSMAGAVEVALLEIIQHGLAQQVQEGEPGGGAAGEGAEAAKRYLEGLSAAGRYQRDVWY